jgi:hypothetical protein
MTSQRDGLFESSPAAHQSRFSSREWEGQASQFNSSEWEDEDERDPFLSGLGDVLGKAAKTLAPLAKAVAPKAAQALASMIPGAGVIAGPLAGKLASALVREGEAEAAALEARLLSPEALMESASAAAQEAALTEQLAAQAAEAPSLAEAEAAIAASLPLTIEIMGGRRALQRVTPALVQANARLVLVLGQELTARQLFRAVPEINRVAIGIVKAQARRNQPITSSSAVRAMAAATRQVLSNPQRLQKVLSRNAAIHQRVAPASACRCGCQR